VSPQIFQVSDLANRRTEFIDEARQGCVRLRDKDGTSLVMLPESRLNHLESVRTYLMLFLLVEHIAKTKERPNVMSLGDNAWVRSLPLEDLDEFASELGEALAAANADESSDYLDEIVHSWKVTARQLEDPLRRQILLSHEFTDEDYELAERPSDGEMAAVDH
jgi:hypothetical protein